MSGQRVGESVKDRELVERGLEQVALEVDLEDARALRDGRRGRVVVPTVLEDESDVAQPLAHHAVRAAHQPSDHRAQVCTQQNHSLTLQFPALCSVCASCITTTLLQLQLIYRQTHRGLYHLVVVGELLPVDRLQEGPGHFVLLLKEIHEMQYINQMHHMKESYGRNKSNEREIERE